MQHNAMRLMMMMTTMMMMICSQIILQLKIWYCGEWCSVLIYRCKTKSSFFIIGLITQRRKGVQNQILKPSKDREIGRGRLKPNLWDSLDSIYQIYRKLLIVQCGNVVFSFCCNNTELQERLSQTKVVKFLQWRGRCFCCFHQPNLWQSDNGGAVQFTIRPSNR